jgi:hypothetical protein
VLALVRVDVTKPLPANLQPITEDCTQPREPVGSLPPSDTGGMPPCFTRGNGRVINSGGVSMEAFAGFLTPLVGRKVINQTGLPVGGQRRRRPSGGGTPRSAARGHGETAERPSIHSRCSIASAPVRAHSGCQTLISLEA